MYVFNEIRTNIAQICAILYVHMYIFIVNSYVHINFVTHGLPYGLYIHKLTFK